MPKPRIIAPGQIYLLSSHGVDDLKMFKYPHTRAAFLRLLFKYLKSFSITCYTFSFTLNQYFLVLRSSDAAISLFMQNLNSAFAKKFNRLRRRKDAVLGRRFDSLISKDDIALTELIRFVNLEPVRNNLCSLDELECSYWSAHSTILGNKHIPCIDKKEVINQFRSDSKNSYRNFVRCGFPDKEDDEILKIIRNANSGKGEQTIIGDSDYIRMVHQMNKNEHCRIKRHILENVSFQLIHNRINVLLNLKEQELFNQGRLNVKSTARELFAYVAKKRFDFSNAAIARYLGVSNSAITRMIERFDKIAQKDFLKNELEAVCLDSMEIVPV